MKISHNQVEKIRLLLSTCQDGTGQLARPENKTLPGWRDFERAVALALNGVAQESKAIYDILLPSTSDESIYIGVSCKMRNLLKDVRRKGYVAIELSNSSGKFWGALNANGIDDYSTSPVDAGCILLELVESWHREVSIKGGGNVDTNKSFYLILQWDEKTLAYQLYQYPIMLPIASSLQWSVDGRRLVGMMESSKLIEWYGHSGGQLKYYPSADEALWKSEVFYMEPLPDNDKGYGLLRRVTDYYPDLWRNTCDIL